MIELETVWNCETFENLKAWNIHTRVGLCQIDLVSIVGPCPKFQLACLDRVVMMQLFDLNFYHLIIKWKPGDVNSAGWLENSWRNLLTQPGASHHNVGWESGVKVLIGAVVKKNIWRPHFDWRNSYILINTVLKMPNLLCSGLTWIPPYSVVFQTRPSSCQ